MKHLTIVAIVWVVAACHEKDAKQNDCERLIDRTQVLPGGQPSMNWRRDLAECRDDQVSYGRDRR